jgi:hypothetical protein
MDNIIPFELVEMEAGTYHILVKAEFGEEYEGWWVIDTGASKSVIDQERVELYRQDESSGISAKGLGKDVIDTGSGLIPEFRLNGFIYGPLSVATVDLHHINTEYSKFSDKRIIGLLGSDFLLKNSAIVNYREKWLII